MHVELVSPERILYSGDARMVTCRPIRGDDIAFLDNHAPFFGAIDITVILLSEEAELAHQIDFEQARREKEDLERKGMDGEDVNVESQLRRAHVRLSLEGGYSH